MAATERKQYQPVWHCIYCGRVPKRRRKLGKEHIIARGLQGALILPRASCIPCADITKKFELNCLRKMFREARGHLNIPEKPRRPNERPTEFRVGFTHKTESTGDTKKTTWINVPKEVHPFEFSMPCFPAAGVLAGKPPDDKILIQKVWTHLEQGYLKKMSHIGADSAFTLWPIGDFCQMLAKIGHAYAVAELGFSSFVPLARGLIRGRDNRIGHFVGCEPKILPTDSSELHSLELTSRRRPLGGEYIVVLVRLFANQGAPTYHVVVGLP